MTFPFPANYGVIFKFITHRELPACPSAWKLQFVYILLRMFTVADLGGNGVTGRDLK